MGFEWYSYEYFHPSEVGRVERMVLGCKRVRSVFRICGVGVLLYTLQACHAEGDCTKAPREALQQALNLLVEEQYTEYFDCMDFGMDLDSTQHALFTEALMRQVMLTREMRLGLQRTRVLSAEMESDSVSMVFFRQYFANGDSIDCVQKMVRNAEGKWLLRLRN